MGNKIGLDGCFITDVNVKTSAYKKKTQNGDQNRIKKVVSKTFDCRRVSLGEENNEYSDQEALIDEDETTENKDDNGNQEQIKDSNKGEDVIQESKVNPNMKDLIDRFRDYSRGSFH